MKYIFVEGQDDEDIIDELVKKRKGYKIIQYSQKKLSKIDGMIKSFLSMGDDYILLADLDEKSESIRKKELKNKYKNLEDDKIYFSIPEIEAWYIAGMSDRLIEKYKVNEKIFKNTIKITKEIFNNTFKNRREELYEIKSDILADFDIEKAKSRNESLKSFLENAI